MELSFSKKAKLEALDNFKYPKNTCCKENFIRGFFFDDVKLDDLTDVVVQPDIVKSTKIVKKLLSDLEIDSYGVTKEKESGRQTAKIYITEQESIEKLKNIQRRRLMCDKCGVAFMTGLFIKNGTVSDPTKEYQLEFKISDEDKAAKLLAGFYRMGFEFKIVQRRKNFVVYTRNSETIEDFLATIGAQSTCLEIMSNKVVKDIRNKINRITNCETANIAKSSKASSEHLDAINLLIRNGNLELLSEDLQAVAYLKLDNPELSLSALAEIADPPLTKSSLNRRLKKLCELAKKEDDNG
ncbi:MAG: DNA-binding protein WhiA [Oscillospiraceae bacterium]|nr:DNA-binding protein WhiA [Oscillospiraceae bacterium]MBP1552516.1 DNA-binding protein WhiA [Oscillospiraceae bacterium]